MTRSVPFYAVLSLVLLASCSRASAPEESASDSAERLPGGGTTNTLLSGGNAFLPPADNITAEHERMFFTGNSFFNQGWVTAPSSTTTRDGLGPLFNARSCASCHFRDGRGAPPLGDDPTDFDGLLLRIGVANGDLSAPHPVYGGQLQPFAIEGVVAEVTQSVTYTEVPGRYEDGTPYTLLAPTYAFSDWGYGDPGELFVSPRVAPQMIGLGLLEAIPLESLAALADPDDLDGDGISGRLAPLPGEPITQAIGRFGWKAEQPTLAAQNAAAFLGDMGISSERHPEQNCTLAQTDCANAKDGGPFEIEPHLFERVTVYTSLLAVPVRRRFGADDIERGEKIFDEMQCASCHVPRHETGAHDFEELTSQTIFPYTDLLLHDMGDGLSDGRPPSFGGGATAREWRTPPLWGIGLFEDVNGHQRLLHDGRARGVAEAILWHGGEASDSRDHFLAASAREREELISFVESL